jgi:hypothetical protein
MLIVLTSWDISDLKTLKGIESNSDMIEGMIG